MIEPSGKFAYVANLGSGNVSAYAIDATSGALKKVKGSPFAAGTKPVIMAVDPSGKFAYVPNVGSNNISAYTIDATSGALTPVTGSPFSAGRGSLMLWRLILRASSPTWPTFYSNNVSAYTIECDQRRA